VLSVGILFFSLLVVCTTIITGSGRPSHSLLVGLGTLILSAALNHLLIPRLGILGAAVATSTAALCGFLTARTYIWRRFGCPPAWFAWLRCAAAALLLAGASHLMPSVERPAFVLIKLGALAAVYLFLLWALRMVGPEELHLLRSLLFPGLRSKPAGEA
jgi:O-antigen/teichoic acid export membrane protein